MSSLDNSFVKPRSRLAGLEVDFPDHDGGKKSCEVVGK